ncbi:hypothetical protein DESUT3_28230 [Desulfuromonas versatilis]|uniref:M23ase beta-sheet core domain-containing protein n=1 Tax=Desulfuromonas versatilis TaxID=2802975 RepID=A0ABM8HUU3_9BACT|nr:M23 family metallopeptidase [Desulfuromonas versatilis]BCR05754.1 hypothetical protein DESUT3_28230 [Desulfuromonas versatilis]
MKSLLLTVLFLLPLACLAGELRLTPSAVEAGGVALLRWEGATPSSATVRFRGQIIDLAPTPEGAMALLGTDLELPPGTYPLEVALLDRQGATSNWRLDLVVRSASHPEERLTLPEEMVSPQDPKVLKRIARERAQLQKLFATQSSPRALSRFALPVNDPLGSPFGLRRILNGKPRSPHAGVDFRSPRGTAVQAPAPGSVAFSGELYYTGKTVILDHGGGLFSLYAHLDEIRCREGDPLEAGQVLGLVGSTGRSTGPHLHWGAKLRSERIDPLALHRLLGE